MKKQHPQAGIRNPIISLGFTVQGFWGLGFRGLGIALAYPCRIPKLPQAPPPCSENPPKKS